MRITATAPLPGTLQEFRARVLLLVHIVQYADAFVFHPTTIFKAYYKKVCSHG